MGRHKILDMGEKQITKEKRHIKDLKKKKKRHVYLQNV